MGGVGNFESFVSFFIKLIIILLLSYSVHRNVWDINSVF